MNIFSKGNVTGPLMLAGLLVTGCKPSEQAQPTSPVPPNILADSTPVSPTRTPTKTLEGFSTARAAETKVNTILAPHPSTNAVLTTYGQIHRIGGDSCANVDATIAYSQAGVLRELLKANYRKVLIEGETITTKSDDQYVKIGAQFTRQIFPQGRVPEQLSELQFKFFTEKWGMDAGEAYVGLRDNVTLVGAETHEGNEAAVRHLNAHQGIVGRPEAIYSIRERIAMNKAFAVLSNQEPVALIYGADHDFSSYTNAFAPLGFGMTSVDFPYLSNRDSSAEKLPTHSSNQLEYVETKATISLFEFAQLTNLAKRQGFFKLLVSTIEFPTADSLYTSLQQTNKGKPFDPAMNGLLEDAYQRKQGPFAIYNRDPEVHQRWANIKIDGNVAGYALMIERSPEFISHVVTTAQKIPVEAFRELSDEKTQLEALPKLSRIKPTAPNAIDQVNAEPVVKGLMRFCVVGKLSGALDTYHVASMTPKTLRDNLLVHAVTLKVQTHINNMYESKKGIFAE